MENLGPLLGSKPGTSEEEITDIEMQNGISTNLTSANVAVSVNNLGYINEIPRCSSNTSCIKCQEIYNMLNQHILESHRNEVGNEKDSNSILKNILTSILTLLTSSNKSDPEGGNDNPFEADIGTGLPKTAQCLNIAASSSATVQTPSPQTTELQQLSSLVSQGNIVSQGNLQNLLKSAQMNRKTSVGQNGGEQESRKTVLQGISLLDAGVNVQGNIPLVLANQLQLDGTRPPTMLAANTLTKTSAKSDLDVADILVNKMPIPSVNKEESSLAQLYLKQLAEGLATGRPDILKHTEAINDTSVSDRDLLNALLNFNNSTGCSIAAGPQGDSSQKPVVETITQIMAAQKQLTNLLSLLGRRQSEAPSLPVGGLASQLIETPLNNPLFTNHRQKIATPGMLQIPLSSILPALAPSSQGFLPGSLIQQPATVNEGNTISLSNLFTRTTQGFPIASASGTITLPALALPTGMFQSSAIPILQQTVQGAQRGTSQPTVLMSSVIPATMTSSLSTSLFGPQTGLQSFIVPGKTVASASTQSPAEPKTLFTFPQSTVPSLTEQLFQNATTIPKFALSNKPSVFNLGNIPSISVLNAGLQSQSLQGPVSVRPIPLVPSTSVIVSSGNQQTSSAVDKIQGLIHAAIQSPSKGTATVTSPVVTTPTDPNRSFLTKPRPSLASASGHNVKMDADDSSEQADPAKLYECRSCGTTFSVLSTLQQHEQTHLGTKMQCNYCNDVFTDMSVFQEHISLHRGQENVHHCEYCGKLFTSRGELQKHLAEHTQKRPYKCSHCAKSFRDPGSLQKHVRIHTGERPYKCTQCLRAFAEYSSLRKHNRVHTGEKPYKCRHCPKAFSISGNLQRHLYIHTGERPYRCTKCPKAFNNPSHLRRHVKNLHEGKKEYSPSALDSDNESEAALIDTE